NDAGSALFAQEELAGELSATQSAECACCRADWGSFARRGRRGTPAQGARNARTDLSAARVPGRRFQRKPIGIGVSLSGRGAGAARIALSRGLPRVAAKAVGDSLCLAGQSHYCSERGVSSGKRGLL